MALEQEVVWLGRVGLVPEEAGRMRDEVQDTPLSRQGTAGYEEGARVHDQVTASPRDQLAHRQQVTLGWKGRSRVDGPEVRYVGMSFDERPGGARDHVVDPGFREEVANRRDQPLRIQGITQMDIGQHDNAAWLADLVQHGPIAPAEAGIEPPVGHQRPDRRIQGAGPDPWKPIGDRTRQTENGLLKCEIHDHILQPARAGDVTCGSILS